MKSELKRMIKKWWVIPVCLLILFPAALVGTFFSLYIWNITGSVWVSFLISYGMAGVITSLPVIIQVRKSDKLKKSVRVAIMTISVLMFSFLAYELFWYNRIF